MRTERSDHNSVQFARRTDPSGGTSTYINKVTTEQGFFRVRSDVVRNREVDGWRKPSAYTCEVHETGFTLIDAEWEYESGGTWTFKCSGDLPLNAPSTLDPLTSSQLMALLPGSSSKAEAEVKALNAVAGRKGKILESFAEARESVLGLTRNATQLRLFVESVARRNWAGAARALALHPRSRSARRARDRTVAAGGGLGSAWLNYSFGIKPIVDDMVFALIILGEDRTIRLKGLGYSPHKVDNSVHSHTYGPAWNFPGGTTVYNRRIERFAKVVLWYEVRASSLARFNELGLYSVPATIWALQPMSFVVDWVLPVQDVLQALTADVGLTFRGGTYTRTVRVKVHGAKTSMKPQSNWKEVKCQILEAPSFERFRMERSVYTSRPTPKPFYVKDPLSVWTAVTSLALLASTIKSSMKGL